MSWYRQIILKKQTFFDIGYHMTFKFSLIFSKRFWLAVLVIGAIALFLLLRSTSVQALVETLTPPDLPDQDLPQNREVLAQNWTPEMTERFHFISQGTATLPIPYDWLIALEQPEASPWGLLWPGANPPFTQPDYIARYGFIPSAPSAHNPDGLPIGFARTDYQNIAGYPTTTTAVGFSCAACHTGRFVDGDTEYLVNGGPAVTDLQVFSAGLAAALGQTVLASKLPLPNQRFDRFAQAVLGDTYSAVTKLKLADELQSVAEAGAAQADTIDVVEGFGRLDALNRIGNQVFSKNTGRTQNYAPINAPVNYPHIWTVSWFDWVQYDGSIMQPLIRNAGEALGVHAAVNLTAPDDEGLFSSAIPVDDLVWIEQTLAGSTPPMQARAFDGLLAPEWPASLGPVDDTLAATGAALYQDMCSGCHMPPLNSDEIWSDRYFKPIVWDNYSGTQTTENAFLALNILPLDVIGTDPAQSRVLAQRTIDTATNTTTGEAGLGINTTICVPRPRATGVANTESGYDDTVNMRGGAAENALVPQQVRDGPMLNYAHALGALVQETNDAWFNANNVPQDIRTRFTGEQPNCLQAGAGYKARPLNGVWATAPFLHNGSVPTLDDLLRPADQRPRFVRLGDPAFDAAKVGLAQPVLDGDRYPAYVDGYFIMDTALDGNRNTGHAFGEAADGDKTGVIGRAISDEERAALIAFLKTL